MYLYAGPFFKGLPVLVYHKISSTKKPDYYTVSTASMREQLEYITQKGYNTIFLSDMIDYVENGKPLPKKPLIIALEDGFRDNYTDLYPLLKEFNCKANVFLVAGFVQTPGNMGPRAEGEFMTLEEVKDMCKEHVQIGLHTMYHKNLHELTLAEIDEDTRASKQKLEELGIPYQPVFAYPYAYYFKDDLVKQAEVFGIFKKHGVRYAFKVGDRLNRLPLDLSKRLILNRFHVSGTYTLWEFKMVLIGFIRITQRLKKILK
jgi:peptidoglycan/xylan/chitin deacetylase (PgdA/CDA1 family)